MMSYFAFSIVRPGDLRAREHSVGIGAILDNHVM